MDFLHQIKLSFLFYWRAFRFIDTHNLWRLLVIPAIINLIIAFLIVVFAIKSSGVIVEYVLANFQSTSSDKAIHSFIEGILLVIIRAFVFFFYLKIYRYLALILLAPLFAIISSKVQIFSAGPTKNVCTSKYFLDCSRGIKIALRNFMIELILTTSIIVISFLIAWILPLAPVVILVLESYFVGYSMADYRNEYFGLNSKESRKLINSYPGLVIGNGLIFNFIILIPLLGVLVAPSFALIASGLSINYLEKRKQILCNSDQSTLLMAKS
jgi:CysZ protein